MDNLKNNFYNRCLVNLHEDEKESIRFVINRLRTRSVIKLLSVDSDEVIDNAYEKYVDNATYNLQISISKIYATLSGDIELTEIYSSLLADMYAFFKQLKNVIDKDIYDLYVSNDSLNICDNFDKTYLRVLCYNINILGENNE